jgi:hypothetical protein
MADPPLHRFVVFSVIDPVGAVELRFAQCNNCGIIHRVTDLTKSEIVRGKESSHAIPSIDDIRSSLPAELSAILDRASVDLATWEAVRFSFDEQRWGDAIVLASDVAEGSRQGKYVRLLGPTLFKVDTFTREEIACS